MTDKSPELDRIDLKILRCLQEDGRISNLNAAAAHASPIPADARSVRVRSTST